MDFEHNLHSSQSLFEKNNFNPKLNPENDFFASHLVFNPQEFLNSPSVNKFVKYLLEITNEPGKRSTHAKYLYSFLKRKQNNFTHSKANSITPSYRQKNTETTHSLSTHTSASTPENFPEVSPIQDENISTDTSFDKNFKRSASVDLFLSTDKSFNNLYTPLPSNDHSRIAIAPTDSGFQRPTHSYPSVFSPYYRPAPTPSKHSFEHTSLGHQNVHIDIPLTDECSWESPPSKQPCFLQYRLAMQYNRCLQLPGVIGHDPDDNESVDADIHGVKANMKNIFAGICKGLSYNALSDCLRHYPHFILDILRGPFGYTTLELAVQLRCFNHTNVANYSTYTHANEVIIPPPDMKKPLKLWIGTYGIPRDDKRHRGGEDVWFGSNLLNAMGVADGVSEWMDLGGINPREFAEDLLRGALDELHQMKEKNTLDSSADLSPSELALKALSCGFNNAKHYGSSTAIIGLLNPRSSKLGIANLGDSGCLVLRRSSACGQLGVVTRVQEMQHGFNIPYQFTHLPAPSEWESLNDQHMGKVVGIAQAEYRRASESGKTIGDTPDDIQFFDMPVCDGDLIIIGTDGLFDNLFDYEISSLTALALSPREAQLLYNDVRMATRPKNISKSLALAAYWKSIDSNAKTPFSKYSRQSSGLVDFNGGKEDDISLAVAWVTAS